MRIFLLLKFAYLKIRIWLLKKQVAERLAESKRLRAKWAARRDGAA